MKFDNKELRIILEELYASDPALKAREDELINIIKGIAEKKPDIVIDQGFVLSLRRDILSEISSLPEKDISRGRSLSNNMNRFVFALYGATAAVLFFAVSFTLLGGGAMKKAVDKLAVTNGNKTSFQKMSKVDRAAFGSLRGGSSAPMSTSPMVSSRLGMGGGQGLAVGKTMAPAIAESSDAAVSGPAMDSKIMPPYEGQTFSFVYKGKDFTVDNAQMEVMRRVKDWNGSVDIANLIGSLGVGYVDLATFPGQKLQSLNFIGKEDYGYMTTVMLDEGIVSIYQNWEVWPAAKCGSDQACYENLRVKESDMLPDQELIAIADKFIADHKINRADYGDPEVNKEWRAQFEAMANKSDFYFPESVEVVYPLKVAGKLVYEEYNGAKSGLSIYVQVKEKKVASVNNLSLQAYEASSYDMETDTKKILAFATKGGFGGNYYWGEKKIGDIELGNPELVLAKHYSYKDGKSQELYIPALSFPIMNPPKEAFFNRKAVIVPLAKDILDEQQITGDVPMPLARPMMEAKPAAE